MSLYRNIHAKRKRIAAGSGEKMRKQGSKGAPTAAAFKKAKKSRHQSNGIFVSSASIQGSFLDTSTLGNGICRLFNPNLSIKVL